MNNPTRFRLLPALLLAAVTSTPAAAQRLMMPDEHGRMLGLFDLRTVAHDEPGRAAQPGADAGTAEQAQHTAELLRHFVEPALRPGDDLCAIGSHWIAVLADEERIASVERLMAAARRNRNDQLIIVIRLLDMSGPKFRAELADELVKVERGQHTSYESVIEKADAAAFLKTAAAAAETQLSAPTVSVRPLQRAQVSLVKEVAYIRDFEVEVTAAAAVANPVIDTVWEGNKSDVCATFLPGGMIGLRCDVQFQELHRPIPTFETQIGVGKPPVSIQLPRTSGVRLANVAEVAPGSLVVLAAQRSNGNFMVAIVQASALPTQPTPAKLR